MSDRDQEIINRLRRAYKAFNRADFDAAMEIARPEIELVPPGGGSALRGSDAMRAWMEPDALEEQRFELRDIRVNGNKALVYQHSSARGSGSGIEVEVNLWTVWTFSDDHFVTRLESFLMHEEGRALEAAGLSE